MKKIMIVLFATLATLMAATTPGIIHFVFDNGVVTTSGDDTFYEFDIQAYATETVNSDDLLLGSGNIYVEYDTELFGSSIAGTTKLEYQKIGLLGNDIIDDVISEYDVLNANNTFSDVFAITYEASTPSASSYYDPISTDSENPSDLFHIKMKAKASGSGEVSFPGARIANINDQFRTLADLQYEGPVDLSEANEAVYIEGPVNGEPYTSIELLSLEAVYKGGMVRMKWKTASETENLGFIIKRVVKIGNYAGIYEEIASYVDNDALLGAGTTNTKTTYIYFDKTVKPGVQYVYILQDVDFAGHIRESEPITVNVPESNIIKTDLYTFTASYPNPFNPTFIVPFELYQGTTVDIKLYDVSGRLVEVVAEKEFAAGQYNLLVDGSNLSSGMYLLKTKVDNITKTQKMLLVK